MSDHSEEKTYRIGEVAEMLNLKTHVLRFWETEFPQLAPLRTGKGQRLYTDDHIGLLRRIQQLLHEQGMTIEGARKVLNSPQGGSPLESNEAASASAVDTAFLGEIAGELIEIRNMLSTEEEK